MVPAHVGSRRSTKEVDIEISSEGMFLNITASGTIGDNLISGTYTVASPYMPELPQTGTFQLRIASGTQTPLQLSDVLSWSTFESGGGGGVPRHQGW